MSHMLNSWVIWSWKESCNIMSHLTHSESLWPSLNETLSSSSSNKCPKDSKSDVNQGWFFISTKKTVLFHKLNQRLNDDVFVGWNPLPGSTILGPVRHLKKVITRRKTYAVWFMGSWYHFLSPKLPEKIFERSKLALKKVWDRLDSWGIRFGDFSIHLRTPVYGRLAFSSKCIRGSHIRVNHFTCLIIG